MTSSDFTLDVAFSLFQANEHAKEKFTVDFNDAWQWIGYSRKDHAKANFMNRPFIEGVDYRLLKIRETKEDGTFSHVWEQISLTVECFKMWGMMAGTKKGTEIRLYFLECERIAKEAKTQFIQSHARIYKPEFPKEFYDELYRVTGYSKPKRGIIPICPIWFESTFTGCLVKRY